MDYKNELEKIKNKMIERSKLLHDLEASFPDGSIQIALEKHYIKINKIVANKSAYEKSGIKKNELLVRTLLGKQYNSVYLDALDYNLKLLENVLNHMKPMNHEAILKRMPANYDLIKDDYDIIFYPLQMHPVVDDSVPVYDAELRIPYSERSSWAEKSYKADRVNKEDIGFKTQSGISVKSKDIADIMDIYDSLGIPVHYDEVMNFKGSFLSPDMVAMRRDGTIIFHEHCSNIFSEECTKSFFEKLRIYAGCGIIPGENLIITYNCGDKHVDLKLAEAQIRSRFGI